MSKNDIIYRKEVILIINLNFTLVKFFLIVVKGEREQIRIPCGISDLNKKITENKKCDFSSLELDPVKGFDGCRIHIKNSRNFRICF